MLSEDMTTWSELNIVLATSKGNILTNALPFAFRLSIGNLYTLTILEKNNTSDILFIYASFLLFFEPYKLQ